MNPCHQFVASFARLVAEGKSLPIGGIPPHNKPGPVPDAPDALVFSPHPDDECVTIVLSSRLLHEAGMRIVNITINLGGNPLK